MFIQAKYIVDFVSGLFDNTALIPHTSWVRKSPPGERQVSVKALVPVVSDSSQLQKGHGFSVSL